MILIKLKKTNNGKWQIINKANNVLISQKQLPDENKALEWCRIFMTSFNSNFLIEIDTDEQ